jgi:hypothetical protein
MIILGTHYTRNIITGVIKIHISKRNIAVVNFFHIISPIK